MGTRWRTSQRARSIAYHGAVPVRDVDVLRLGAFKTIYSFVFPETARLFDELRAEPELGDLYERAWTRRHDAMHEAFFETWLSWSSPSLTRVYPLVVARGDGVVIDDVDGNRFLDFNAGIAVAAAGHSHPIVNAAIHEQVDACLARLKQEG